MSRRVATIALLVTLAAAGRARAAPPPALEGVGVDEHPGARIPLELGFTDAQEHAHRLGDFFRAGRPVVLVLAYARCQLLCSTVLETSPWSAKRSTRTELDHAVPSAATSLMSALSSSSGL